MLDLYERFERLMFSTARKYGGKGDFPEEAVQESLVKLIGKVELLRELSPKALAAYVAAVTRNTAIDYLRARERQNAVSLDGGAFSEQEAPLPPLDELMGDAERENAWPPPWGSWRRRTGFFWRESISWSTQTKCWQSGWAAGPPASAQS